MTVLYWWPWKQIKVSQNKSHVLNKGSTNFLDIYDMTMSRKINPYLIGTDYSDEMWPYTLFRAFECWWPCGVFSEAKGTFTYYVIICDLKNLVSFGHKELWRPLAANRGFCDFKDVVAYGHNQLWRPPVAKLRLCLQENDYVICEQPLKPVQQRVPVNTIRED